MVEEDTSFITFDGDTITKSEIRDEIIDKYIAANLDGLTKVTDFNVGSEAYHLADVMASYILEHREMIDLNYRMSMIHYAEGEFLDNFGDMVGVHRKGSSPSTGEVTFSRLSSDQSNNIIIPDGAQIATNDAISFIVDNDGDDIILPHGESYIEGVPVLCELEGEYTNVLPGTVNLVMGDLGNLVSVTNPDSFTGGEDIEDDDTYRSRILLAPFEVPVGSLAWYEQLCNELESIHDTRVEKGTTQLDSDVIIYYNPTNDNALSDLEELFSMKEYDIVGVSLDYVSAQNKIMLEDTGTINTYYFAVQAKANYSLDLLKEKIIRIIRDFNEDSYISIEFNPGTLASLIENEVEGIQSCRIVLRNDDGSYTEIVEPVDVGINEVCKVDLTEISSRIVELRFNVSIEVE